MQIGKLLSRIEILVTAAFEPTIYGARTPGVDPTHYNMETVYRAGPILFEIGQLLISAPMLLSFLLESDVFLGFSLDRDDSDRLWTDHTEILVASSRYFEESKVISLLNLPKHMLRNHVDKIRSALRNRSQSILSCFRAWIWVWLSTTEVYKSMGEIDDDVSILPTPVSGHIQAITKMALLLQNNIMVEFSGWTILWALLDFVRVLNIRGGDLQKFMHIWIRLFRKYGDIREDMITMPVTSVLIYGIVSDSCCESRDSVLIDFNKAGRGCMSDHYLAFFEAITENFTNPLFGNLLLDAETKNSKYAISLSVTLKHFWELYPTRRVRALSDICILSHFLIAPSSRDIFSCSCLPHIRDHLPRIWHEYVK
jgi:hypothetical protein